MRDYQGKACENVIQGFKNAQKQLIVLPTGSGKTFIFWNIIKKMGLKTLILVHTKELLEQGLSTGKKFFPDIYCCSFKKRIKGCQVHINTIQSSVYPQNLSALKAENYSLIIVDECHRSGSKSYRKIFDELNVSDKYLLGCTATPFRSDGQSIYEIFGYPEFTMTIQEMIKLGYLCDLEGYRVKTNCSMKGVRKNKGDFQQNQLESVINVKNRNELIVKEYLKTSPNEKAIVFCISVNHANEIRNEFLARGIACQAVHGNMPDKERERYLKDFREGYIKILANCQLLTEGYDEPSITTLLMARPTCSRTLYIQMIGRGSRLFPTKKICKIIEFTDNTFEAFDLASCLESNKRNLPMEEGERFSDFYTRIEEMPEGSQETISLKETIIPSFMIARAATSWQIKELQRRGVKFIEPLMESTANFLLSKG